MKINEVTKIEYAPTGKRFFAFFVDIVLTLFIGLGIYIGVSRIFSSFDSVSDLKVNYNSIIEESNLFDVSEEEITYKQWSTYEECVNDTYNFYNNFLPKYNSEKESISPYWYNVFVLGLDDAKGEYSSNELEDRSNIVKSGSTIFEYKENEGNKLYDEIAIPIAYQNGTKSFSNIDENDQTKILSYFMDEESENKSIAYFCTIEVAKLQKLNDLYNDYILWNTTIPLVIGLMISYLLFFLVVPLCLKDGKTLGKLFLKISLVSSTYYSVKKGQIVLRYLPQICIVSIVTVFIGINILTLAIMTLIVFASYLMAIFKENHASIHDAFAKTIVVLDVESTWFKDSIEEQAAIQAKDEIVG